MYLVAILIFDTTCAAVLFGCTVDPFHTIQYDPMFENCIQLRKIR